MVSWVDKDTNPARADRAGKSKARPLRKRLSANCECGLGKR